MKFTLQISRIKDHLLDSLLLTSRDDQLTGQVFCFTEGIFLEAEEKEVFLIFAMTTAMGLLDICMRELADTDHETLHLQSFL